MLENYELSSKACIFELDFTVLAALGSQEKQYTVLQRFPSAERDLAIIVSEDIAAAELEEVIINAGGDILAECRLFDVYRGKQIPENKKSLAYSLIYRSPERTLTDEEINEKHEEIKQKLFTEFGAELR